MALIDDQMEDFAFELKRKLGTDSQTALKIMRAYEEAVGPDVLDLEPQDIADAYVGQYDRVADFAREYVADNGMLSGADEIVEMYFDYQRFGTDLLMDGYAMSDDGYVFYA